MIREIAPTVPGRIKPGLQSSIVIPSTPIDMRMTIRFGSISVSRIASRTTSDLVDLGAGGLEQQHLRLGLHAVDLVQERRQVGRDHVDDIHLERLARAEVRAAPNRRIHPLHVSPVFARKGA
jgi:hypothetical protein